MRRRINHKDKKTLRQETRKKHSAQGNELEDSAGKLGGSEKRETITERKGASYGVARVSL